MSDAAGAGRIGLCFTCRWMRAVTTRRGSTFFRCSLAETDPRFVRYPPLPVLSCPGYEQAMLFVVLMHYTEPLAAIDAVRAAHLRHLETHAARGIFHAWARRDPPVGGVLIAAAPDRATLEAIVAADPYVKEGVARAEVVEFNPKNVRRALRVDP
ncbi:MAG TPA: YciI family protein [Gemmatimonadales bacterium]|nr:YciI family protein [Gemmatimonadales bacterium]